MNIFLQKKLLKNHIFSFIYASNRRSMLDGIAIQVMTCRYKCIKSVYIPYEASELPFMKNTDNNLAVECQITLRCMAQRNGSRLHPP